MQSGVAKGVAIGSYRDSETKLAATLISRLPKGSTIVMDRFYEKPTFLDVANELVPPSFE